MVFRKGQPIIFGLTRIAKSEAEKARKEGLETEAINISLGMPLFFAMDLALLPGEILIAALEKLQQR